MQWSKIDLSNHGMVWLNSKKNLLKIQLCNQYQKPDVPGNYSRHWKESCGQNRVLAFIVLSFCGGWSWWAEKQSYNKSQNAQGALKDKVVGVLIWIEKLVSPVCVWKGRGGRWGLMRTCLGKCLSRNWITNCRGWWRMQSISPYLFLCLATPLAYAFILSVGNVLTILTWVTQQTICQCFIKSYGAKAVQELGR